MRYYPPMVEVRRHYREVKKALKKSLRVDPFFVGKFGFSPYQACAHGCLYCDGRAEKYWVEGEFDRDIVVRKNLVEVLRGEVGKLRERGIVFVGSGISDAYQPPEKEEELMRGAARVMIEAALPVTILTKSALILRDLDLWLEVNRKAGFLLMISLQTLDEEIRRVYEPQAGTVEERLETLRVFKQHGCTVGVAAMPFLPLLSDSDEQIRALVDRLSGIGVDFVLPGGLTLRPGRQKAAYLETLRAHRPDLLSTVERLYAENRPSGAPTSGYLDGVQRRAVRALNRAGIPTWIPHRVYRNRLPIYDEVDVLLQHMAGLYADHEASVRRLREASGRYQRWLEARKSDFNRRRSLRSCSLEAGLTRLAQTDGLQELIGNPKLTAFLGEVILERRVFDYRTLQLS
jgi:DNA repair photolyase